MSQRIALIILAAGKSTRFPGNKLLAKINDESIIERLVKTCLDSKVDEIIVVTGYEEDKIWKAVRRIGDENVKIVYNPRYEEGQSTSVKKGVNEVFEEVDAVIIHPADVAFIDSEDINSLIEVFKITDAPIVVASYRGRRGHPILLSKKIFNEIMKITEEKRGLKEIVERYWEETIEVESSPYVVIDVDTPEDLKKILNGLRRIS